MVLVVALVVGLTACQPQTVDQTPSVCRASLAGSYQDGEFASGRDRATLRFPQGAEIRVTGTVTNIDSVFGAVLSWSLSPVASGIAPEGGPTAVDETFTYTGTGEDIEVVFRDQALFGLDFEWDLKLSATANGCPPATPEACIAAGGNYFFSEPVIIDDVQREGCFQIDSCIDEMASGLSEAECDEDDVYWQVEEQSAAGGVLVVLRGAEMWVTRNPGQALNLGSRIGTLTVAGFVLVATAVVLYIVVDNFQGDQAVQTRPDLVQDVVVNNPALADHNPGLQTNPDFEARMRLAMATCIADIAISEVIDAASQLGLPTDIDPVSGLVEILGQVKHICELVPVYMPGGSTHANGLAMQEATFHIRDVLYGERNGLQNYEPTDPAAIWPTLPRENWQVLTRRTSRPAWYASAPYGCRGSGTDTACDEFPYGATTQGGPGAHLRIIDFDHNSRGGADWNPSFVAPVSGCNVPVGASFVVVPLEAAQIRAGERSIRLC